MLLTQRAMAEGNRAFAMYCAAGGQYVIRQRSRCEKTGSCQTGFARRSQPLPPKPLRKPHYGMQIFGGHGYIKEWAWAVRGYTY